MCLPQLSTLVTQLQADLDKKGKALIKAKTAFHQKSEAAESALSQFEKSQQDPTFPPKSLTKVCMPPPGGRHRGVRVATHLSLISNRCRVYLRLCAPLAIS